MLNLVVNIVTAGLWRFNIKQDLKPDEYQSTRRTKGAKLRSFVSDPVRIRSFSFGKTVSKQFLYKIFGFPFCRWIRVQICLKPAKYRHHVYRWGQYFRCFDLHRKNNFLSDPSRQVATQPAVPSHSLETRAGRPLARRVTATLSRWQQPTTQYGDTSSSQLFGVVHESLDVAHPTRRLDSWKISSGKK
jgi:hypothetical protein